MPRLSRDEVAQLRPIASLDDRMKDLVTAVIEVESNRKTDAVSRAGAKGLMQLMPAMARYLGVQDPFDPE